MSIGPQNIVCLLNACELLSRVSTTQLHQLTAEGVEWGKGMKRDALSRARVSGGGCSSPSSHTPMCWPGYITDSRATYFSSTHKYSQFLCALRIYSKIPSPTSLKINSEYGPPFPWNRVSIKSYSESGVVRGVNVSPPLPVLFRQRCRASCCAQPHSAGKSSHMAAGEQQTVLWSKHTKQNMHHSF